jgi:CheY-like chemotaxis protein/HPt (histidine-containing phosphotransfer) domain-containing protein
VRADQKGLELICHIEPGVPNYLAGDSMRLGQVLVNLVGNAIKFTERGEVTVFVQKESQTANEVCLHFQVTDTGIGVAPGKQSLIFEAFSQADGSTTRRYGGTGLGLAITSQFVELMEGRIWVESPVASLTDAGSPGSSFHFTVNLGLSKDTRRPFPAKLSDLRGLPVLVVDDNHTNRRILEQTLASWQMKPTIVDGGQAALDEMKRAVAESAPFRLVLLDVHMPEMDGFMVAERIREKPELAGAAIMMLSSGDQNNHVARCHELGLDVYLVKPIRQSALLAAIQTTLGVQPPDDIEHKMNTQEASLPGRRPLRVLLTEDNQINQRLAVRVLEKRGHTVEVVSDGKQAVDLLAQKRFDVVLMDVQMPKMNGYEATAAIREQEHTEGRHTPIIAMTAYAMEGDRERCLAAGMDAYISKPIRIDELLQSLEDLVSTPALEADANGDASGETDVDFAALIASADGDIELARELVEIFLDDSPKILSGIRSAFERADHEALERGAHSMKGMLGYFSNRRAVEATLRLQTMSVNGDWAGAREAWAELEKAVESLKPSLAAFGREYAL